MRDLLWKWLRGLWMLVQIAMIPGMIVIFTLELFLALAGLVAAVGGLALVPVTVWVSIRAALEQGVWGYVGVGLALTLLPLGLGYLGDYYKAWEIGYLERLQARREPEDEE